MKKNRNRYSRIIETIFLRGMKPGITDLIFKREELISTATELGIELPRNLGDVVYSFRYRASLPESIKKTAPEGFEWVIRPIGQSIYKFSLTTMPRIIPNSLLGETKYQMQRLVLLLDML